MVSPSESSPLIGEEDVNCTPASFSASSLRDIEDLIRNKVLVKDSAGGRSTSYSMA